MIPNGWEEKKIGEVCRSIVPGRNKPKKFDGTIPWITTPEITGKYIPSSGQINFISEDEIKKCGGKIVPENAVVMSCVGNLGLTAITKSKVVLNQQLHAFVCPPEINHEYLLYYLSSKKSYMESLASKTTIPYLNKTSCESIPILIPPLREQEKIAKILFTWDEAIEKLTEVIIKKQRRKSSLTNSLLTGKKRFSEFGLPRNQDTSIPNGWKNIKLSAFTEKIGSGKTPKGGESAYSDSGILFIRSQNVYPNQLRLNDLTFISKDIDASMKNSRVIKMDVLLNITGASIGRCCVYKDDAPANVNQHVCIIRTKSEIDPVYLSYFLNSDSGQKQIKSYLTKGNREGLNFQQIGSFEVPIPPTKPEQTKIARFLTIIDEEIEVLGRSMVKLQTQKQGLMQQLLTGKKRVKV